MNNFSRLFGAALAPGAVAEIYGADLAADGQRLELAPQQLLVRRQIGRAVGEKLHGVGPAVAIGAVILIMLVGAILKKRKG